eukprot:1062810-Amphidinium_carterae.1
MAGPPCQLDSWLLVQVSTTNEQSWCPCSTRVMVPLVDLTNFRKAVESNTVDPLPDEAKAAVTQWKDAFKTIGFAHVTGHGVPEA